MHSWTLTDTHPTRGRTFQRPLDPTEFSLFLDGHFRGASDCLRYFELRLLNPSGDVHLFSDVNIVKAWLSTKRRFPLAGATIQVLPESGGDGSGGMPTVASEPHFIVREHDLAVLRPHEIVFQQVACAEDVTQRMDAILDGSRFLSDEHVVQLHVFRETDSQRTDTLHLIMLISHCVADETACRTITRCLLDTLARGDGPDSEPAQSPLEERLAMEIPSADLEPMNLHSLARQRWRRAIATVIFQLKMEKDQGGHTLPCRRTRATPYIPARHGFVSTLLTQEQTTTVLANCRLHGLTFGNAYLALAQVAMTRVLYRRYLRGEISEEEWTYRKMQPHKGSGPLNLRPYLDRSWYERGGGGEFMVSTGMFMYQLPPMTLGGREPHEYAEQELSNGAPPFSDLLTFSRFLHHAELVKKQGKAFFDHPLFLELIRAASLMNLHWKKHCVNAMATRGNADDNKVLTVTDMAPVFAYAGSSLGNMQWVHPTEYPLPSTHPLSPFSSVAHPARAGYVTLPVTKVDTNPKIVVENSAARTRPRPAELYFSGATFLGRLNIVGTYDCNVYEEGVVTEWLDEIRDAVLWYLGQTHQLRHIRKTVSRL